MILRHQTLDHSQCHIAKCQAVFCGGRSRAQTGRLGTRYGRLGSWQSKQTPTFHCRQTPGRPKVLYVMGAGRSGSTILGVALGNCGNVFFAGELDRWLARSGVPRDGPERTRFWSVVREGVDDAAELFGGKTTSLERSSALLDIRKWPARRRLRQRYRRVSEDLYLAIRRVTGMTDIVDSSHYPLRAREAAEALQGIDLYLLFLVRDPQGVVASLGRDDVPERRFGVPRANAYLWLTYVLSVFVFLRHPRDRRLFVRHEDFVADPGGCAPTDSSALRFLRAATRLEVPSYRGAVSWQSPGQIRGGRPERCHRRTGTCITVSRQCSSSLGRLSFRDCGRRRRCERMSPRCLVTRRRVPVAVGRGGHEGRSAAARRRSGLRVGPVWVSPVSLRAYG